MSQTTATVRLNLESKQFSDRIGDVSNSLTVLTLGSMGAQVALGGLGAAARTNVASFALGAEAAAKLDAGLVGAAANASRLTAVLTKGGDLAIGAVYLAQVTEGIGRAANEYSRIPQALAAIEASGVSTRSIQEMGQLKAAFAGNQEAVDGFVSTAISRLGQFEQAASRSGTILRSATRFDDNGSALRANQAEGIQNALSVQ